MMDGAGSPGSPPRRVPSGALEPRSSTLRVAREPAPPSSDAGPHRSPAHIRRNLLTSPSLTKPHASPPGVWVDRTLGDRLGILRARDAVEASLRSPIPPPSRTGGESGLCVV